MLRLVEMRSELRIEADKILGERTPNKALRSNDANLDNFSKYALMRIVIPLDESPLFVIDGANMSFLNCQPPVYPRLAWLEPPYRRGSLTLVVSGRDHMPPEISELSTFRRIDPALTLEGFLVELSREKRPESGSDYNASLDILIH